MSKGWVKVGAAVLTLLLAAGCLYPAERHHVATPEQVETVQQAVNAYREDTGGLLPILNRDQNTPLYRKYPVDFSRLIPRYLPYAPPDSFEEGGYHQYVLVDVEEDPKVRLLNLVHLEVVNRVQQASNQYWIEHRRLPVLEERYPGFWSIDYSKLKMEEQLLQSPYSLQTLPLIMDLLGYVGIDYGPDIGFFLSQGEEQEQWEGRDLRELLVEKGLFVPDSSFPYYLQDGTIAPVREERE